MRLFYTILPVVACLPAICQAQLYGDYSVRVEVEGNGYAHYTTVYFDDEAWATDGYDPCCEALLALGNSNQPHVYTQVISPPIPLTNRMSINAFPLLVGEKEVPLGFLPGTLSQYLFTFKNISTIPSGITVQLEDVSLNITQDLRVDSTYETWGASSDLPERFVLHFNPEVTEVVDNRWMVLQKDVNWTKGPLGLTLYLAGAQNRNVSVFDLSGSQVAEVRLTNCQPSKVVLLARTGIHIIKVSDDNGNYWTEKTFVKNF